MKPKVVNAKVKGSALNVPMEKKWAKKVAKGKAPAPGGGVESFSPAYDKGATTGNKVRLASRLNKKLKKS